MKVCIGGTFNILHKGHEILIEKAFQTAGNNGRVFIGLTKGKIIKKKKNVKPYEQRLKSLKKYLLSKGYNKLAEIRPIYDEYGPTINEEFDAIVVSSETVDNAEKINKKRKEKGKKPIIVIEIPMVIADDQKPISSTRINKNEIDRTGRIL